MKVKIKLKKRKRSGKEKMGLKNRGKLLTPSSAAERLGIPRAKIYQWVRSRRFQFIKPGRELLFWEQDFISFLDSNTVPAYDENQSIESWE